MPNATVPGSALSGRKYLPDLQGGRREQGAFQAMAGISKRLLSEKRQKPVGRNNGIYHATPAICPGASGSHQSLPAKRRNVERCPDRRKSALFFNPVAGLPEAAGNIALSGAGRRQRGAAWRNNIPVPVAAARRSLWKRRMPGAVSRKVYVISRTGCVK
jgi:hypothetical protein